MDDMKVLLVFPRYGFPAESGKEEALGILYIAAALRKASHEIRFVDLTFETDLSRVAEGAKWADVLGVSSTTPLFDRACAVVKEARKHNPSILSVLGGPHATGAPQEGIDAGFDYCVIAEGEETVAELLDAVSREGGDPADVQGLVFMKGEKIHYTPGRPFPENLDPIAFPARDLMDYDQYPNIGFLATRGCPCKCYYCQPMEDKLFGKKFRRRTHENILQELMEIKETFGDRIVHFKDDTMTFLRTAWFEKLGDMMEEANFTFRWWCNSRVDCVNEAKLEQMKRTGCELISFGVESGSDRILKFYKKGTTAAQAVRAFEWCKDLDIQTHAYLMLGAPIEERDDLELTYQLVRRIQPDSWGLFTTTPTPGSGIYDFAQERGLMAINNYDEYNFVHNANYNKSPMKLENLTPADITEYKHKINRYLGYRFIRKQYLSKKMASYLARHPMAALKEMAGLLKREYRRVA